MHPTYKNFIPIFTASSAAEAKRLEDSLLTLDKLISINVEKPLWVDVRGPDCVVIEPHFVRQLGVDVRVSVESEDLHIFAATKSYISMIYQKKTYRFQFIREDAEEDVDM